MTKAASRFAQLAGSAALGALAVSSAAQAGNLYSDSHAVNHYRPDLSIQVRKAAGDDLAGGTARGFVVDLEYGLCRAEGRSETECKAKWNGAADNIADNPNFGKAPVVIVYPKQSSPNMLVMQGVAPPKALETSPIPVCAEQNGKVLGTWKITNDGQVLADAWNGATTAAVYADGRQGYACKEYIVARRGEMNQQLAEQQQKPVSVAANVTVPSGGAKIAYAVEASPKP